MDKKEILAFITENPISYLAPSKAKRRGYAVWRHSAPTKRG